MRLRTRPCPNCGAPLQAEWATRVIDCDHCHIPCEVEELSASNPAQLPDALLDRIETKLGVPVRGRSRGPCADDLELPWR